MNKFTVSQQLDLANCEEVLDNHSGKLRYNYIDKTHGNIQIF